MRWLSLLLFDFSLSMGFFAALTLAQNDKKDKAGARAFAPLLPHRRFVILSEAKDFTEMEYE